MIISVMTCYSMNTSNFKLKLTSTVDNFFRETAPVISTASKKKREIQK